METEREIEIGLPKIVERGQGRTELGTLLVKDKAATRARDALAAERRRLPMVRLDKTYVFAGQGG